MWWGVALAGLVLFLVGNLTARMGITLLPFDPHHLLEQGGGALLAIGGTLVATGRSHVSAH